MVSVMPLYVPAVAALYSLIPARAVPGNVVVSGGGA